MDELRRLGGTLLDDPPIARTPVAELERRAARRRGRRRAVIAVAVGVALLGIGGLVARSRVDDASVATGPDAADTDPRHADVSVFLRHDASPAALQAVRARGLADPRVTGVFYESQDAAYQDFQCLFADTPEMLDSVTADVLPPSFRLWTAGDRDTIDAVVRDYTAMDGVQTVTRREDPAQTTWSVPGSASDLHDDNSACPVPGERLR